MSSRKGVLHLTASLNFGGVEKHFEIIARHSNSAQHQPIFCAIAQGGATERLLLDLGHEVVCLGADAKIPNLKAIYKLTRFFLRTRPLIVHTHGAEANFHGILAAWIARVPVRIAEEIGIPTHSSLAKLVFATIYKSANRVIGISDAVVNWLSSSGEVNIGKAVRLYNPVILPHQKKSVFPKHNNIFRIGFVGRLEPVKNPMVLLDVVNHLNKANFPVELWIVGEGSLRSALERQVDKYMLKEQVILFGYKVDPYQFIQDCDIYIQPSISEGFGLAVVEAMGCGIPVIATAVGGIPEIIQHEVTGWIVPESDLFSIMNAVNCAISNGPEKLISMGISARKAVECRFSPENYIAQLEEIYQGVLNRRQ